ACVHEVENNERGLDRGNAKGDDNVELMKVLKRSPNGDASAGHQRRKDREVIFGETMCSDTRDPPTDACQSGITTGTNRSTQYQRSASTSRRFRRACCTAG